MNIVPYRCPTSVLYGLADRIISSIKKDSTDEQLDELCNKYPKYELDHELSAMHESTALHHAVAIGNLSVIKYILNKGDVEDKKRSQEGRKLMNLAYIAENHGAIPLHMAPLAGDDIGYKAVKIFEEHGIPIDATFRYTKDNLLSESLRKDTKKITVYCLQKGMTCHDSVSFMAKFSGEKIAMQPHIDEMKKAIEASAFFAMVMKDQGLNDNVIDLIQSICVQVFFNIVSPLIKSEECARAHMFKKLNIPTLQGKDSELDPTKIGQLNPGELVQNCKMQ